MNLFLTTQMRKLKHVPDKPGKPVKVSLNKYEALTTDLSQYVTTDEAANLIGLIRTSINHLIHRGRLRAVKVGRDWLVFRPSVEEYIKTKSPKGRPTAKAPKLRNVK